MVTPVPTTAEPLTTQQDNNTNPPPLLLLPLTMQVASLQCMAPINKERGLKQQSMQDPQ